MGKPSEKYRVKIVFKKSRSKKEPFYYVIKSFGNYKILAKSENYGELRAAERSALLATGGGKLVLLEYEAGLKGRTAVTMPADLPA